MRFCSLFVVLSLTLAGAAAAEEDKVAGADIEAGKAAYKTYCFTCHGNGDGQGPVGKTLKPPPRDFIKGDFKYGGDDQAIFDVISNGAASKGGSAMMAPWGAVIPEDTRWALVKYIRSLQD